MERSFPWPTPAERSLRSISAELGKDGADFAAVGDAEGVFGGLDGRAHKDGRVSILLVGR